MLKLLFWKVGIFDEILFLYEIFISGRAHIQNTDEFYRVFKPKFGYCFEDDFFVDDFINDAYSVAYFVDDLVFRPIVADFLR